MPTPGIEWPGLGMTWRRSNIAPAGAMRSAWSRICSLSAEPSRAIRIRRGSIMDDFRPADPLLRGALARDANAGLARLGEADRNGLLPVLHRVLPLAGVFDLLVNVLPRPGGRRPSPGPAL